MRLLLDTNVVLDVLLARPPWVAEAQALWQGTEHGRVQGFLPASALTDIFYIVRRASDLVRAREAVTLCLVAFEVCPISRATPELALEVGGSDFEDNVVLACAIQAGLDGIVTREPAGFRNAPLPILSPTEALARLNGSP